jgi:flagellar M-ring protein FliF
MISTFWNGLGRGGRVGLVAGALAIVAATGLLAWWTLRADYQVLFADLTPQDAAAMAGELEKQKVAFSLDEREGGTTILVDRNEVHKTRIKMMGRDLPLHGAVGFELFNNSDFGMTEFAQKVNYQRALQGELTRTILSLSEVRDARVLLALPEQGLFKQNAARPKASITLSLRQGQALRPEQVAGIQRLVAAAVPGISAEDVTLVDQWGVALTRVADGPHVEGGSARLDVKRDVEGYLARKAGEVLDRALGAGQALASVDVTLNLDRVQVTTEEVVGAPGKSGHAQTGVVVRERDTQRDLGGPLAVRASADGAGSAGGSSQREVEYAVGRRVEQVVSHPGAVRRIQVVAVVRRALDAAQQEQIARMVAASVGASTDRGDTVVVHSMEAMAPARVAGLASKPGDGGQAAGTIAAASAGGPAREPEAGWLPNRPVRPLGAGLAAGLGMLLAALVGLVLWLALRGRGGRRHADAPLTEAQREAALVQVQTWLRSGDGRVPGEAA